MDKKNKRTFMCYSKDKVCLFFLMSFVCNMSYADTLFVGMSAAFTGPSESLGIELYRGAMSYFEYVNRHGGIQGRKIAIKAYDGHFSLAIPKTYCS